MRSQKPTTTGSSGAELLVESLIRHGVDVVFGVPGDTGIVLYDVFAKRTAEIRHVLARDERHTGYMADGYARTHHRIAVCEASSGAGAVYLASGLAESYASSIPVLTITTDIHRKSRGSSAITEIDQLALFSAVTKWRQMAERAADIPQLVTDAITAATTGRPGPVALIFPEDVLEEHADVETTSGDSTVPGVRAAASVDAVDRAIADLAAASQPVILAGGGVHTSGAWRELRELAEHAAIPVATTIHGKGAIPEDHPLSLGIAGGNGSRGYSNEYLESSDAVLIVGSRANSTDTNGFTAPSREGPRVIQVDTDASRAGNNFPGSLPLVGDAMTVLVQLRAALPPATEEIRTARRDHIAAKRAEWDRASSEPLPAVADGLLQPREVTRTLRRVLGAGVWVAADAGTPTPNLSAHWETSGEGWRIVIPRGHGAMGYSISAAIGIAIAHPGERVLCVTTESSLAMGIGDWETAARLELPITFVVLDNTSMCWIKMLQYLYLDKRYFGVDPGPIHPVLLAKGMGLRGATATDIDHLEGLAKESVDAGGPFVIHVPVPEHMDSPPPVAPWQARLTGQSSGRPVY